MVGWVWRATLILESMGTGGEHEQPDRCRGGVGRGHAVWRRDRLGSGDGSVDHRGAHAVRAIRGGGRGGRREDLRGRRLRRGAGARDLTIPPLTPGGGGGPPP